MEECISQSLQAGHTQVSVESRTPENLSQGNSRLCPCTGGWVGPTAGIRGVEKDNARACLGPIPAVQLLA